LIAATKVEDKLISEFRTGKGIDWREHDKDAFDLGLITINHQLKKLI
jgi:hypothetical protein